jgi:hypothetical protein
MKRVIVHIERLVLDGVDRADADGVARGLQGELQRLMTAPGVAQRLAAQTDTHRVRAGKVRVARGGGAADTGRAAAGGIVRGLRP